MIVVDSCGWLAFLQDEPSADFFAGPLDDPDLVVPTIVAYEVYKVLRRAGADRLADLAVGQMQARRLAPLTDRLAVEAADFSLRHGLAMADAIVYATAQAAGATLFTSDDHFRGLPGVKCPPPVTM